MKKVTIFALHLGYGGIEKSIIALSNAIVKNYEVEIISTYRMYEKPPFPIDSKIKVRYLIEEVKPNREEWKKSLQEKHFITFIKESFKSIYCLFLRRSRTIKAMREADADILISTRTLFNTWLGKYAPKNTKKVGWEHNHHHGNVKYVHKVVDSCKALDELVLVSDSLRSFYKKEMKKANYKCHCSYIPNILEEVPTKLSTLEENRIVSIGRFSREKGFPDLIDVFSKVHEKKPELILELIGDGPQRNMIVDKIYQYKLESFVHVHGFLTKKEMHPILEKSSLYIMTSFTESFGLVLVEAMSYGIPTLAFSSAEGACDLIENGKNGYLINERDKDKMAEKIIELMNNLEERKKLGKQAREKSLEFTEEIVKEMWLKLLK